MTKQDQQYSNDLDGVARLEKYICTLYDTKDQLKEHIYRRADQAFAAGDEARDRIVDLTELQSRQQAVRQFFLETIGGLPSSEHPLNARITKMTRHEGYMIENVLFESRPKQYVTGLVYKPSNSLQAEHVMKKQDAAKEKAYPAVLFLSGHEYEAKHSLYYHEICLRFVEAGMIVLAIDPPGQGERIAALQSADGTEVWGTAEHQRLGVMSYAVGCSVARYFVHDAMRAVDYLLEREDVDASKIGVTGNSGGGTQTTMMMMADSRIAAAAPATFMMNRKQYMHAGGVQDAEQIWHGFTAKGYDHEDILLSFAPKPTLVCAVEYDFFPIEATRLTVERSKRFWKIYGQDSKLQLATDQSVHKYTDRLAEQAVAFFKEQFARSRSDDAQMTDHSLIRRDLQPAERSSLLVTKTGQVRTDFTDAIMLSQELAKLAAQHREEREQLHLTSAAAYENRLQQWLKRIVLNDESRKPSEFNPRFVKLEPADGLCVQYALWWSQRDVMNSGYLFSLPNTAEGKKQKIAIAVWPRGTHRLHPYWNWVKNQCQAGYTVLVLNVSGDGPHAPHLLHQKPNHYFFGMVHKLADELLWLGDSLAALRIYDVWRAISFVKSNLIAVNSNFNFVSNAKYKDNLLGKSEQSIELHGAGLYRIYTMLAAKLAAQFEQETIKEYSIDSEQDERMPRNNIEKWLHEGSMQEEDAMAVILPNILQYIDFSDQSERVGEKK